MKGFFKQERVRNKLVCGECESVLNSLEKQNTEFSFVIQGSDKIVKSQLYQHIIAPCCGSKLFFGWGVN